MPVTAIRTRPGWGNHGGYRNYFSDEQNANIDSLVRDRLNPVCGYR